MTSDQIDEAQKLAREMVEANPKLMGEEEMLAEPSSQKLGKN